MASIRKIVAWPLCLLLGFSLFVSGSCEVLCFGNQGHVEIEPVHFVACCEVEPLSPIADMERENHNHHDCAGCSDIPLDSPQWWQRSRVIGRPIMNSHALSQAAALEDQGAVTGGGSVRIWTIVAGTTPAVPMATATTVLRC